MAATFPHLTELLEDASSKLAGVSRRRMFGCDALFVNGEIYALVWKTGRIGLKLPEPAAFDELMDMQGADPWKAGPKTMSHWVLVPEEFHEDSEELARWVRRAHSMALGGAAAAQPAKKKAPAAKAAKKRSTAPAAPAPERRSPRKK
jgi:TfoX/Sxy family transcriptional regulator of competence genes